METKKDSHELLKAKRKVRQIRTFYQSLIFYLIFIGMLSALNYYLNQWEYPWFLWATFGWGIGLCVQALKVFEWENYFGKSWEQKKLKQLLENPIQKKSRHNRFSEKSYPQQQSRAYLDAKRKVEILKGFYSHIFFFIVINFLIIYFFSKVNAAGAIDFSYWGNYLTLFLWGIGLVFHGLYVLFVYKFKNGRLKRWEQKKLKEILEKDYL